MKSAEQISESMLTSVMPLIHAEEDIIVIHSDVTRLGFNREIAFIDGLMLFLQSLLDSGKTVVLPSFTFSFTKDKNFNIETSPYETGSLAWLAKTQLGFTRTCNPMFSFCVKGPKSGDFINSKWDSGYGKGTSVELLSRENTCIIMLGCNWDFCTLIHNVEETLEVPYREYIEWNYPMDFGEFSITESPFQLYVRKQRPKTNLWFSRIRGELETHGYLRQSTMNNIMIESANGNSIAQLAKRKIIENPNFFIDIINS